MPLVEFALGVIPPKERPRRGRGGHIYNPPENRINEGVIAEAASRVYDGEPTDEDVTLWLWVETPPRGDTDNSLKLLKDALQGVIYRNDVQVSREHIHRTRPGDGSYVRLEWGNKRSCCRHVTMPTSSKPTQRNRRAKAAR